MNAVLQSLSGGFGDAPLMEDHTYIHALATIGTSATFGILRVEVWFRIHHDQIQLTGRQPSVISENNQNGRNGTARSQLPMPHGASCLHQTSCL